MSVENQVAKSDGAMADAKQIDYNAQKFFRHPSYRYMPQYPNTFGQPINLGSSQIASTVNLPPEVFNLSQSYLCFTLNLPAVANNYIWYYTDVIAPLGHLQHYCQTNQYIVDIDNANKYLKAIKKDIPLKELMTLDPINGISTSNTLANVVPALRHSGSIGVGGIPAPSFNNYTESSYFQCGALNTAVTLNFVVPLNLYKNTFLAFDKDVYYGITSYFRIYWDVISRICYTSTSNAGPSAGVLSQYNLNTASITNLQLMLAIENNTKLVEEVKAIHLKGISYVIPYAQSYKNPNSNGTQSISIQFDVGSALTLAKVYHQVYNNAESLDTAYDCSNNGTLVSGAANAVANQKVQQYYTQINGRREQDLTLDCTFAGGVFSDYMYAKRHLVGSSIESLNAFQYNWLHVSDYLDSDSNSDNIIGGIPLSISPITWTFYGSNMTAANYQHYTFAIFFRKLILNGNGAILQTGN
jgi:hypothetical protein